MSRTASASRPTPSRSRAGAAAPAPAAAALVRMGELSRLSGVPSSTIKHYLREGLLPGKSVSIARNSALYDRSLVDQIRHIKDLQTTHFLPLWRIKEVLAGTSDAAAATVAAAVDRVLEGDSAPRSERVAEVMKRGLTREEHGFLVDNGLIAGGDVVTGDDLVLCETIVRAREAGLTDRLSTLTVLDRYRVQVAQLVAAEIGLFQEGIVAGAGERLATSTVEAMKVSERLVTLMRRRMLLPIFEQASRARPTPSSRKMSTTNKAPARGPGKTTKKTTTTKTTKKTTTKKTAKKTAKKKATAGR